MRVPKRLVLSATLAMAMAVCATAQVHVVRNWPSASTPGALPLGPENNGQTVAARVGQRIELTLGTVGPARYDDPQISSPAIRLDDTALYCPPNSPPSPGGATYTYTFVAVSEGTVEIKLPLINSINPEETRTGTFSITIRVGPGDGKSSIQAALRKDQENSEYWDGLSTILTGNLHETFIPSMATLTAVEIELVPAHSGPSVTRQIDLVITGPGKWPMNGTWQNVQIVEADLSKTVSTADCAHVLFLLPNGGLKVSPGEVYTIRPEETSSTFAWKYVVGGYPKGAASASNDAISPLPSARSTFLFKTFGTN